MDSQDSGRFILVIFGEADCLEESFLFHFFLEVLKQSRLKSG